MLSMTGFGKGTATYGVGQQLVAEVSSLNRKQLEIRLCLPPELSGFEPTARKLVGEYITRGSVQLRVSFAGGEVGATVSVNRSALIALAQSCQDVRRELGMNPEVNVEELLRVPGIVVTALFDSAQAEFAQAFEDALRQALEHHLEMRRNEGESLRKDFESRIVHLEETLAQIEILVQGVPAAIKQRLVAKIKDENLPVDLNDERLLKEILFYADKADVTEEVTRLCSHITQLRRFLYSERPAGRDMDFLMQEFFREITTLGNKAGTSTVSPLVVAFKSELEKLREQIQNVE